MVRLRIDTTGILVTIIALLLVGAFAKHENSEKKTITVTPTPVQKTSSSQPTSVPDVAACSTSPVDYVLITDRSGSMKNDNKGVAAKAAAKAFIDDIAGQSGARVGLVSFEDVGQETTDLNLTTNFSQAKSVIDGYVFSGMTCTRCGINLARTQYQNNARAGARKVVVLLTDGMPWHSDDWYDTTEDEKEIQNILSVAQSAWSTIQMQIYAIGLGDAKFQNFLPDLVNISGGKSYITNSGSNLDGFYSDILKNTEVCATPPTSTPVPGVPTPTRTPTPVPGIPTATPTNIPPPTPTRTPTPTPTPIPTYTISGSVYVDANRNGIKDAGEAPYANIAVTRSGASAGSTTTDASGNYTFTNLLAGNYSLSITAPAGYQLTSASPVARTIGPSTVVHFGVAQLYNVSGNVFFDANRDGVKQAGESNFQAVTINRSGTSAGSTSTDINGNYTFPNPIPGNYSISVTVPAGYQMTTASPIAVTPGPSRTVNFGIALLYSVRGNVFVDGNKDGFKNNGESNFTGAPNIGANRGTVSTTTGGLYAVNNLTAGSVLTSYLSLPPDYYMTYPLNGPPPSHLTTVGAACSTNGANGASCVAGDVIILNIGISNFYPWVQTSCGNVRVDDGVSSRIPNTAISPYFITTNSSCGSPGIVYTGDSPSSFGRGQASNRNWVVGGTLYPEDFGSTKKLNITTAYDRMLAKVQKSGTAPTNLSSVCNVASCSLPVNLASGIYISTGDVNLRAYTASANKKYIILVQGNLNINGSFLVPQGSASTVIFSVKGNINVDETVGITPSSSQSVLDGIYSTDRSFVVESTGDCTDLRLNIGGAVITNAALTNGGIFKNDRDLCSFDGLYPTISLNQRLDMLIFASPFLAKQQMISSEVAP